MSVNPNEPKLSDVESGAKPSNADNKDSVVVTSDDESCCGKCVAGFIWVLSMILICLTFPFSLFLCIKMVQEYERAVIFRLGRVVQGGAVGPGLFFVVPCIDSVKVLDIRTIHFDVDAQEILTKDSVTVTVDAVIYYKIKNPMFGKYILQLHF